MKRLLLCLMFLPAFASATIPLVTPVSTGNLTPLDGRAFSSQVMVQMAGDEIAVLDPADNSFGTKHGSIYLFANQGGSWHQTAKIDPPGGTEGVFRGLAFRDDVLVVSIKPTIETIDGARYRSYVLERVNGAWTQTVILPDRVTGPVRIHGNWMAVPRRRGIEMWRHLGFANWQSTGELAQEGLSYFAEDLAGPGYAFDGQRVLIGSDVEVRPPDGSSTYYFNVAARLYQLDSAGQWSLVSRIATPEAFNTVRFQPEAVSLSGNDASVLGHLYRDNGYGYWESMANLSPISASTLERMQVQLLGNGMAWVLAANGNRDLYVRDAGGFWQPRLRMSSSAPAILATQAPLAVGATVSSGTAALSVINVESLSAQAHIPAHFFDISLHAYVRSLSEFRMYAGVYLSGAGTRTIRNLEYRVGAGPWLPMESIFGAYDAIQEWGTILHVMPEVVADSSTVCLRVTDSEGRQSEMLDRAEDPCPVLVGSRDTDSINGVPDNEGPVVETPLLAQTQLRFGEENVIYAFADDSGSGEICTGQYFCEITPVIAMQFRIDSGVWRSMKPFVQFQYGDFRFRGEMQAGFGDFPPATELGQHTACVRALDSYGNDSALRCVDYEVTP